jgi:hypothetical protein
MKQRVIELKYICGNLCKAGSGIKEILSLVYAKLDDSMSNVKKRFCPRAICNLVQ